MAAEIFGLERYGLVLKQLKAHSERSIWFSVQLKGPDLKPLYPLSAEERLQKISEHLWQAVGELAANFELESFTPRDSDTPWTNDAKSTVGTFRALARSPLVSVLFVDRISGLRKNRVRKQLGWYSVRARVAIQVEGQTRGLQSVEDRIVMLRAYSEEDACQRLEKQWRKDEEPYLNPHGDWVRWHLEEIVDVYEVLDAIDPNGTEVWSSLRSRRMKKEYEWHGERMS